MEPPLSAAESIAWFSEVSRNRGAELYELPLRGSHEPEKRDSLTVAWLGPHEATRVLVHIIGVHGVEGLAGSALQAELVRDVPRLPNDVAAVWIHGVNPFGMAYERRVNRQNIDLNRNCLAATEPYAGCDPLLVRLSWVVLPGRRKLHRPFLWFVTRILAVVVRYGIRRVAQAIAGGQYDYPQGLFYGGQEMAEETATLLNWSRQHLVNRRAVAVIDFHTGLGSYGDSLVLNETQQAARGLTPANTPARGGVSEEDQVSAYQARGELITRLGCEVRGPILRCCIQEIGTYPMVYLLWVLSEENHFWHWAPESTQSARWRRTLRSAFFPPSPRWRRAMFRWGQALWNQCLDWLCNV